jgi:hypothetical protein
VSRSAYIGRATIPSGQPEGAGSGLLSLLGESTGTEIVVDYLNGDDTNGTGSLANPYKTVTKAYSVASLSGGRIYVRYSGGTENRPSSGERWTLQRTAAASSPVEIRTYPGDNPDYTTGTNLAKMRGSFCLGGTSTRFGGVRLRDLEILNTVGLTRGAAGVEGVKVENFRDCEIMRCWIHQTVETGILLTGSVSEATRVENFHVHHNRIHRCGTTHPGSGSNHDHGIYIGGETVGGAHDGQVYSNLIYDCHYGSCIQFFPYSTGVLAVYNTLYDTSEQNAPDGAAIGNPVMFFWGTSPGHSDNVVSSNIIARGRQDASGSSTSRAVESNAGAGTGSLLKNNLPFDINNATLWASTAMWANNATRVEDNLTEQDPLWVDVAPGGAKDFRLQALSPARDAGELAYLPDTDFFGNPYLAKDIGGVAYVG